SPWRASNAATPATMSRRQPDDIPHDRGCARGTDDQTRRRGRPPRRPFARELAAFRRLVWLPTSAAALTSATLGFLPMTDGLTVATLTSADVDVPGLASRAAGSVRWLAPSARIAVAP